MQNNRKDQEYKQNQNQDSAMQGTFLIRKADETDVVGIMKVMNEAQGDKEHPDWFVADNEDYIHAHLKEHGFVVVAESSEEEIAGFFLIKYPENKEDNLGTYLDFDEEQLVHVAVMDSAVVGNTYRGNGLQGRMLEAAENFLNLEEYYYLMCTIHPDNQFSRHNMENHGYEVKKIALCYGGLPRCILLKNAKKNLKKH